MFSQCVKDNQSFKLSGSKLGPQLWQEPTPLIFFNIWHSWYLEQNCIPIEQFPFNIKLLLFHSQQSFQTPPIWNPGPQLWRELTPLFAFLIIFRATLKAAVQMNSFLSNIKLLLFHRQLSKLGPQLWQEPTPVIYFFADDTHHSPHVHKWQTRTEVAANEAHRSRKPALTLLIRHWSIVMRSTNAR